MCGIAGFYNSDIDREHIIRAMTDRMEHRGPDADGHWIDPQSGWTFGHRRLSIVDLSPTGAQPMHSASGRFVITYNGEIYNAHELRKRLLDEKRVTAFRGTSDTEVLLEAIEAYGIDETLRSCKGMFAFAVYDRQERTIFLARDRGGEKPLYYGMIGGDTPFFAFASDCALFRCIPGFQCRINRDALAAYMLYKFIPAPMSAFEGVHKLEPGAILTLREPFNKPEIHTYWSLRETALHGEAHPFTGTYEEAKEQLESLITASVRDQMVADVPVGAFLSGGIDSPMVVSLMQKLSDRPVKTFTIGYDDPKVNEAQFAKDIAKHLGTDHTELYLTEKEMKDIIPSLPYYFSEPLGDSSVISTYFVSKLARSRVTVSLSGDAGDELFCGYERYWEGKDLWNKIRRIPYPLRNTAGRLIDLTPLGSKQFFYKASGCLQAQNVNQACEMFHYRRIHTAEHVVCGGSVRRLHDIPAVLKDEYSAMQLMDMEGFFTDDILYKVDRASMAHSLESRIPMLDRDVLEFAWTLPSNFKYAEGTSKRLLRDILYQYVPRQMLERPKQGFWVPIKKWLLEGSTYEFAQDIFAHCTLVSDGYLNRQVVSDVWKYFRETQRYEQLVFNILMAEQWYRSIKS